MCRVDALKWLISKGADRKARRLDGLTPMELARVKGHAECERVLQQADDDDRKARAKAKAETDKAAAKAKAAELKVAEQKAAAAAAALLAELEAEEAQAVSAQRESNAASPIGRP